MSLTTFIVDDLDPSITYHGHWIHIGPQLDTISTNGPLFNGTAQAPSDPSNNVSFNFSGTSIAAFGTPGLSFDHKSVVQCFVDNDDAGDPHVPLTAENNWPLCRKDKLPDGPHHFAIRLDGNSSSTSFVFDYLEFTTSNTTSLDFSRKIDHTGPEISYHGNWGNVTNVQGKSIATQAISRESTAIVNFTGTKLTWVGLLPSDLTRQRVNGFYTVDSGNQTSFSPRTSPAPLKNQIIFTTQELSNGNHSVIVTYKSGPPLVLQHLYVDTIARPSPSPTDSRSYSPFASPDSPTSTSSQPQSVGISSSGISTGKIAGAVIGGVICLLLLLVALILLIRRRRRSTQSPTSPSSGNTFEETSSQVHTLAASPHLKPGTTRHFRLSRGSAMLSDISGYNEATIEQTRALRKGEEAARDSRRTTLVEDLLPLYTTN